MNFLQLHKNFMAVYLSEGLTHTEFVLYYVLLEHCNVLGWPEEFSLTNNALQLTANISRNTLAKGRERLAAAGLIEYRPGDVSGVAPVYRILPPGDSARRHAYIRPGFPAGANPAKAAPAPDSRAADTRTADTGAGEVPAAERPGAQPRDPEKRQEGYFKEYCSEANRTLRQSMLESLRRDNPNVTDDIGLLTVASEAHFAMARRRHWHDDYPAYVLHLENLMRVINRKKHESSLKQAARNEEANGWRPYSRRTYVDRERERERERERREQEFRDHIAEKLARGQAAMLANAGCL